MRKLGICLTREGKGAEAAVILSRVFALKPSEIVKKNACLALGSAYWLAGDLDNAISTFEELRSLYSYVNSTMLTMFGFIYLLKEDYEKQPRLPSSRLKNRPSLPLRGTICGKLLTAGKV